MSTNIKLKRSSVQGKVPTTTDLELGELAVNTYDGKLYMKKDDGTESIVDITSGGASVPTLNAVTSAGNTTNTNILFSDNKILGRDTTDASDNGYIAVVGGGAESDGRGAIIRYYGNEHSTNAGELSLASGNVTGGKISMRAGGTSDVVTVTSSGVGINDSNPLDRLSVAYNATAVYSPSSIPPGMRLTNHTTANTADQAVGIQFQATSLSGTTTGVAGISAVQYNKASSADLVFQNRNAGTISETMRINYQGNVGIGTSSPASNLDVVGSTGIYQRHSSGGSLVFDDSDTADASTPMSYIRNTAGALQFGHSNRNASTGLTTNSAESMRIDSSGNVGIGTSSPSSKLDVNGTVTATAFSGPLTGNVTGTATSADKWTSSRTVAFATGDVTGSFSIDGSADVSNVVLTIAANSVALGTDTTGNYVATISGTANEIEVSGSGSESAAVTIGLPDSVSITSNLTVGGNLTINGTTTTVNATTITLDDPIITLGGDTAPSSDDSKDRGIEFRWHNGTSAKVGFFGYDNSTGYLTFIPDATNTSEAFSGTLGDIQATNFRGGLIAGDNEKAIFGAGSDLQIYHDGSNSYIKDAGTGDLYIASDSISILNADVTEFKANFTTNGAVDLFYDGSKKLATTSTGIDVTGTVTADGLSVDGGTNLLTRTSSGAEVDVLEVRNNATAASTASTIKFVNSTAAGSNSGSTELVGVRTGTNTGDFKIRTSNSSASMTDRMLIDSNGDISFYEDTGVTPKFFWDASAERLGIGTSSPAYDLDVDGSIGLTADATNKYYLTNDGSFKVSLAGTGSLVTVNSSGNVGIGTTSPAYPLHVWSDTTIARFGGTDTGDTYLNFFKDSAATIIKVQASQAGTGATNLSINPDGGNVGIGTSSPSSKLDVNGDMSVNGNIAVTGTVDGVDIASFKSSYDSHNHDDRYYTETESDGKYLLNTTDTLNGILTINTTNDAQLQLTSADSWTGIGFNDSAAAGAEYLWHNGTNGTFALGGSGSNVSGKKLHVHGGMTIGSGIAATAMHSTNGLEVEGTIKAPNLQLSSATPTIYFNGTADGGDGASSDMAIKATPEGLDFYEPEDGNKIHFQILDDTGVNAPFGYKVGSNYVIDSNTNISGANGNFSGSVVIDGDLTVSGNTITINATELAIEDNLIYLNEGSTITNPDIGIVGNYNDGTYAHTGVFRDATDGRWKFFKGYVPEPGQTIDTANATFQYADVQANTFYGELSGNASTATTLQTARTIALSGDVTGSASFNGSANITITATVANDSHTHAFNNLTSKTSGTGDYATSGDLVSGKGSGGVALTINDGYGNANVTWNHQDGVPEQNGNAARIEVNTDSTSGATMYFELLSNVTANTAVQTSSAFTLTETYGMFHGSNGIYLNDTNTKIAEGSGNSVRVTTNSGYLEIGPQNTNWSHFQTDRAAFYFNTDVAVDGTLRPYADSTDTLGTSSYRWLNIYGDAVDIESASSTNLVIRNSTNAGGAGIDFSDNSANSYAQKGYFQFYHSDAVSPGSAYGATFKFSTTETSLAVINTGEYFAGSTNRVFHDGYHPNADKWTTARTITLAGDATGSVSLDGSANVTLTVAVANDSHTHDTRYVRKDDVDNGAVTIRVNDADFIVKDSTDSITNFIWRDHSASKLYLGTSAAVTNFRSDIEANSDGSQNIGSDSTRFRNIRVGTASGGYIYRGWKVGSGYSDGTAIYGAVLDNATGTASYLFDGYSGGTSGTKTFHVRGDGQGYFAGDVGIGTTSPTEKLHVDGNIRVNYTGVLYVDYDTTTNYRASLDWNRLQLGNNGENYIVAGRTNTGGYLKFVVNNTTNVEHGGSIDGTTAMTITSSGYVGIGTTSPASTLDVRSESVLGSVLRRDFNGAVANTTSKIAVTVWGQDHDNISDTAQSNIGPMIGFGARVDDVNPNTGDIRAGIAYSYNGDLTFHAIAAQSVADGSYERMRIDGSAGYVGIGTTSPASKLHIKDSVNPPQIILEDASGGTQTAKITYDQTGQNTLVISTQYQSSTDNNLIQFAPADNIAMTIRGGTGANNGNVGIGTTAPGTLLDVNGTARATQFRLASTGVIDDATATTTATTQVAIDAFSASAYGGSKLLIEAKTGSNRHITELLVTHDGTTAIATEYGAVYTSGVLATYDVDISSGNVRILATPASSTSTSFKVMRTTMFA